MKKTFNTFLILSVVFLITGSFFKIYRMAFADIFLLLGLAVTVPISVILFFIQKFKKQKSVFILLGALPVLCAIIGLAFFINHFEFGEALLVGGFILSGIYLIIGLVLAASKKMSKSGIGITDILILFVFAGIIFSIYSFIYRLS